MDPTTVCCPNLACPARGQPSQGHRALHAQQAPRCLCHACHNTCSATTGTVCYRRRPAAETVALVVTVRAHGCPVPAMGAACGVDERPVAAWWARAGRHGQAVQACVVAPPRDVGQVHAEAIRVTTQGGIVGRALAMMVKTRVWLGGEVRAQRARPLSRRRIERVKRGAARRPVLVCPAGVVSSMRALRETCRAPVHTGHGGRPRRRPWRHIVIAHVVKRSARRRVVETARRLVDGTPARVETRRRRAPGDGVIPTASSERLHATCRARLASLTRRGRALARHTLTRQHGMDGIGTVDHGCTPHARLAQARGGTTPAMAAGITDQGWTVQELLSFPVPPPRWTPPPQRGRPSHAFKRLIERWCGDHGSMWCYRTCLWTNVSQRVNSS